MTRPRVARYPLANILRSLGHKLHERLDMAEDVARHGDLVELPFPIKKAFLLSHPDDIRHVLQEKATSYRKSFDYRILSDLMGEGLITSESERWRLDRRVLQPSFNRSAVSALAPVMERETNALLQRWRRLDGEHVEIFDEMMQLTIKLIGRRLFDADVAADAGRIRYLVERCIDALMERTRVPVDVGKYLPLPSNRRFRRHRSELRSILASYMRPLWASAPPDDAVDLVSVLRTGGVPFERALDHVLTLFAAGYDTTGSALGWCLYNLAQRSELQARVRGSLDDDALIGALIEETMRRYPSVPVLGREAIVEDVIAGKRIPRGATMVCFIYGAHHRDDVWTEPQRFDVDRFLQPRRPARPERVTFPFGSGPRKCIGAHFAMLEMRTAIVAILSAFELTPDPAQEEPKLVSLVSLRTDRPVHVKIRALVSDTQSMSAGRST